MDLIKTKIYSHSNTKKTQMQICPEIYTRDRGGLQPFVPFG